MDLSIESILNLNSLPAKHLVVVEEHKCIDGGFVISSILEACVKRSERIVLVLFHHTFGHYHGVGVKLGYNLENYKQQGKVHVINGLSALCENPFGSKAHLQDNCSKLQNIFLNAKNAVERFRKEDNVTVVLEHPTDIIIAGENVPSVMMFGLYMRSLVTENVGLLCLTKQLPDSQDLCAFTNSLHYHANISIQVKGLNTGSASDIHGMLVVLRKNVNESWDSENCYHFQLLDKRVRLFAPGFVQIR